MVLFLVGTRIDRILGSFGSTFWHNEGVNGAAFRSNKDTWSMSVNTSTIGKFEKSRDGGESRNHEKPKKMKREG